LHGVCDREGAVNDERRDQGDQHHICTPLDGKAVTNALAGADAGDPQAAATLFTLLYRELHRLARAQLHARGSHLTLGATTLLHEAYLDISRRTVAFPDRARFFAYAARAMRGLIIDHVRNRMALKRGSEFHLTAIDTQIADSVAERVDDLGPLHDALEELAKLEPELAQLVDLKFFCGLNFAEIAALRNVSERTVQRDWNKARLFLHQALKA
jgi:RNA polymerase sigma factor (TIGR02999 family)